MAWTRKKKVITCLAVSMTVSAVAIGVICYVVDDFFTGWHCPPTAVSSLAEVPYVGSSLSAWQTSGPVYYRYRPGFGEGCVLVITGVTSSEAIATFQSLGRVVPDRHGNTSKVIAEAVKAFRSVPEFTFRPTEENSSFCWEDGDTTVTASLDLRSGWFVAIVGTTRG